MRRSTIATAITAIAMGVFALAGTAHAGHGASDRMSEGIPTTYVAKDGTVYEIGGPGSMQLVAVDASGLAHWQICGNNVLGTAVGQKCDNSTEPRGPKPPPPAMSLANVDLSDAAHWQICGVNVLNSGPAATCDNTN